MPMKYKLDSCTCESKAAYFISNNAQNTVVALKINSDGTLCDGSITPTGGTGESGISGATNMPAGPDSLFSQSPLMITGNFLFAVNPGSNTLSLFSISLNDATKLTPIGNPVSTLGEFPISVTAHPYHNIVCVANSGAKAGVACSTYSRNGLSQMDGLREFDITQATPPVGPTNTVSQTFFSDDGTQLFTTVKGNPAVNTVGFFSSFPVKNGKVSMQGIQSSPTDTAVLFGVANIPRSSNILVTDASFGAAILVASPSGIATTTNILKIANQVATCWATYSPVTGTGFVTDVGVNHLVEVIPSAGVLGRVFNSQNGNPGMIDLASNGKFVYALSPGNDTVETAVTVFDVVTREKITEVQNFKVEGAGKSSQGIAIFYG
ncbi:hypothetical protein AOQ84DRAFT_397237 [Glonium stellatum]|uniref:3-carboxymuconate cyclase n=1 Tax=Glonium stellatum TaxID=574774 RepID=A0A8E2F435_9PEZI|nr:hypothetical protein AOQ84DRAFT_397237 [Glonium stellatum]